MLILGFELLPEPHEVAIAGDHRELLPLVLGKGRLRVDLVRDVRPHAVALLYRIGHRDLEGAIHSRRLLACHGIHSRGRRVGGGIDKLVLRAEEGVSWPACEPAQTSTLEVWRSCIAGAAPAIRSEAVPATAAACVTVLKSGAIPCTVPVHPRANCQHDRSV